jgi:gluconokinase
MIVIVMGVAGSGKSSVAQQLAVLRGWRFVEGDTFHPGKNLRKMASGQALTDADRAPFYAALRARLLEAVAAGENLVLACSALKAKHRALLNVSSETRFVYLEVAPQVLWQRLEARADHFFPSQLLASQLKALEDPVEVNALVVHVNASDCINRVVQGIDKAL